MPSTSNFSSSTECLSICASVSSWVARDMESQRSSGQVSTSMSDLWRGSQGAEDSVDVGEYPISSIDVVVRDVLPNLVEICERIGMESVAAHPPNVRRSLFSRSVLNASSPSIGFTRPLLRSS